MKSTFCFGPLVVLCIAYTSADPQAIDVKILNSDGRYRDAVCPCPRNFEPICANDLHIYGNRCMFECARKSAVEMGLTLQIRRRGSCSSIDADDIADHIDI